MQKEICGCDYIDKAKALKKITTNVITMKFVLIFLCGSKDMHLDGCFLFWACATNKSEQILSLCM